MDNDSRGLLFFIFGFTCLWLLYDEFYGKKRITNLTNLLTPNIPNFISTVMQPVVQPAADAVTNAANSVTGKNLTSKDVQNNINQSTKDKAAMPSSGWLPLG